MCVCVCVRVRPAPSAWAGFLFVCLHVCALYDVFMYAQYILLKCYCGKYVHFLLMTVLLGCCPLCTLPYLFYNHFANKCGKGQIGKPPKY